MKLVGYVGDWLNFIQENDCLVDCDGFYVFVDEWDIFFKVVCEYFSQFGCLCVVGSFVFLC